MSVCARVQGIVVMLIQFIMCGFGPNMEKQYIFEGIFPSGVYYVDIFYVIYLFVYMHR